MQDIASVEYVLRKQSISPRMTSLIEEIKKTHNSIKNKLIKHLTDSAMKAEDKGLKGDWG